MLLRVLCILTLSLLPSIAVAGDWTCTDVASVRRDRTIFSCGVGTGPTEADARIKALENANKEFQTLCLASADCRDREVIIEPKRNSCEQVSPQEFKCTRGVEFQIQDELRRQDTPSAADARPDRAQPWTFGLGMGYAASPLEATRGGFDFPNLAFNVSLERALGHRLGMVLGFSYLLSGNTSLNTNGNLVSVGIPIYFGANPISRWFIMPEMGWLNAQFTATSGRTEFSQTRFGLTLGHNTAPEGRVGFGYRAGFFKYSPALQSPAKLAFFGSMAVLTRF